MREQQTRCVTTVGRLLSAVRLWGYGCQFFPPSVQVPLYYMCAMFSQQGEFYFFRSVWGWVGEFWNFSLNLCGGDVFEVPPVQNLRRDPRLQHHTFHRILNGQPQPLI